MQFSILKPWKVSPHLHDLKLIGNKVGLSTYCPRFMAGPSLANFALGRNSAPVHGVDFWLTVGSKILLNTFVDPFLLELCSIASPILMGLALVS